MYYGNGNYEAFVRPLKPENVENKSAYIVGAGLAGLTAAFYLVRDGQMKGENIHILERCPLSGGACDGYLYPGLGFTMRGGREMDSHFEVMWDVYRDVPSIETENASVLDEYYWLNKKDPNYSLMRATMNCGQDGKTNGKMGLSDAGLKEILKLFITPDEELYNKKITDVFTDAVFTSNFWLYWRTMFAFENWHSALEVKLYLKRFIHHIKGMPDFSTLRFTKYNQYESMILPLVEYLKKHKVHFSYDTNVVDVTFSIQPDAKCVTAIEYIQKGKEKTLELTDNDLVFMSLGGCVENSSFGSQNTTAEFRPELKAGGGWSMWKNIAAQDPSFGHPDKFCSDPNLTNWMSATVTTLDRRIVPYIEKICKRDPFNGGVVTGGIVTVKDSNWLLSWTFNRQPQFRKQPKDQLVGWIYGLFSDKKGNYIQKTMQECTGKEICMEWLYHLGVPEEFIEDYAENSANTIPCMMPYITAFFMPREKGDRPDIVPHNAKNFAFIGEFVETPKDTVFTTEYAMRTAMEAVYTLLDVDRAVPDVWSSAYDICVLLDAGYYLSDKKKLTDMDMNLLEKLGLKLALNACKGTDIEQLLRDHKLI